MKKKVIVLGGGLSGLSSAVFLAHNKIPVNLIEASSRPGGRVSSFPDTQLGLTIDNGQHIMMGCYTETLNYLNIINARDNFFYQKNLEINFIKEGGTYSLRSGGGIFPFNLLSGLLSFNLLSLKEKLNLLRFFLLLPLTARRDLEKLTAREWLINSRQTKNIRESFWNVFVIGALNTIPEKASALLLRKVLLQVFYSGRNASSIIIPDKPLSEAFCTPAIEYLIKNSSEVNFSERVLKLETDLRRKKVKRIITSKRIITDFSYVVSAIPLYALKKIISFDSGFSPVYSSILTLHFKSSQEIIKQRFAAILNSPIHWIFRHPEHYTLVISNADEFMDKTNEELRKLFISEISSQLTIPFDSISSLRIIKEKRATFVPSPAVLKTRPGTETEFDNLLIAGDWTDTSLPATIESAVLSGKKISYLITGNY